MPAELPEQEEEDDEDEEEDDSRGAVYWNPQVRSFVDAAAIVSPADEQSESLRSQGFTTALAVPQLGMFRGQASVVSLGDGHASERVIRSGIAHSVTLWRDNEVSNGYPTSAMGAISLVRQTLHDADWYVRAHEAHEQNPNRVQRPESNTALAALAPALRSEQPLLFETRNDEELLRAHRITEEFPISIWIRGSGYEYRLLDVISELTVPLILPIEFPEAPELESAEDGLSSSLAELRHWYLAPENPARLASAGVEFALTADHVAIPGGGGPGNQDEDDEDDEIDYSYFLPNLRVAVERGLPRDVAISSLTTTPARLLGIEQTHGSIEAGKAANLVVVAGDLFSDDGAVRAVWIEGDHFEVDPAPGVDPRGRWTLAGSGATSINGVLSLEGPLDRLSGSFAIDGQGEVQLGSAGLTDEARRLSFSFTGDALGLDGITRFSGTVAGDELFGWGELPDGARINFRGERVEAFAGAAEEAAGAAPSSLPRLELRDIRPAIDYGRENVPDQPENLLIQNATIWTMGPQGVLESADLLVREGVIVAVGTDLEAPGDAQVIDATGMHVTPGLIDPHLHSGGFGGINETGSAIVPEVRIGDILTLDNIWMYRQLAGGLTTAHVLHGSANPIGGQNALIKLRWGLLPEELKFEGAPRTVKFALGENPVRREGRYPDTRMGTQQIIRDHFKAAREYERTWAEWERTGEGLPPRRDLRMEALVDILNEDILVHSHAYRQDEILMLMRLAEEFDFRITAFQHSVEAYKVAPDLARHGAAATVWSDWGGFKIEAYDNTTYNARILTEAGVLTSLHSDDSQIATRMNWEAAKMLRAGMDEVDALALVTINPATLLKVDDRIGSLEPDKEADFVIWNGHPLSAFTVPQQTWIDGTPYYDIDEDHRVRKEIERERAAILQVILDDSSNESSEKEGQP
ncbi:MAG: amidohydrolase family protein [Gemmatimonas sp.]|nr:amidohydrolase family protein [Gemmatimonas sp.]